MGEMDVCEEGLGGARIDNFGKMEEWCERRGNDRKIGGFSEIEE